MSSTSPSFILFDGNLDTKLLKGRSSKIGKKTTSIHFVRKSDAKNIRY